MSTAKPKIAVIGTGGTISSIGKDPFDLIEYPDTQNKLAVDELLDRLPQVHGLADLVPLPYKAIGSTAIGPADWLELVRLIHGALDAHPDLSGIVVTHGTATTEETAYFLNLTLKVSIPVVVVGAQRPLSGISSDAPINLANAIRTASSPHAQGLGVLVVLNDEIQAAREVTKTATLRMQTFRSPDFGVIGHADADEVRFYRHPIRRHMPDTEFDVAGLEQLPRVDICYSYAGADGTAIKAFMAAGARGIVSAGFAPGNGTPDEALAMDEAIAAGVAIVQSSRAGSGRVTQRRVFNDKGIVAADNLNPQKARVLLMLALTLDPDFDHLVEIFKRY